MIHKSGRLSVLLLLGLSLLAPLFGGCSKPEEDAATPAPGAPSGAKPGGNGADAPQKMKVPDAPP